MSKKTENPRIQSDLLTTTETAQYINCSTNTLKTARCIGVMFGVPAPAYLKMGFNVRYKRSTIKAWLEQFEDQPSTAYNKKTNAQ